MYFFAERNWPLDGGFPSALVRPFAVCSKLVRIKTNPTVLPGINSLGLFLRICCIFFSHRKREVPSYISAGLWLPLFTVFNPIFIDLFLRVSFAEVVWRLCFLITVELYAAWYLVRGWQDYIQSGNSSSGS